MNWPSFVLGVVGRVCLSALVILIPNLDTLLPLKAFKVRKTERAPQGSGDVYMK